MTYKHSLKQCVSGLFVAVGLIVFALPVGAQDSELTQQIEPVDCTATNTNAQVISTDCQGTPAPTIDTPRAPINGSGGSNGSTDTSSPNSASNPPQTAPTSPSIRQIVTSNQQPTITGTFDAATTKQLSVTIGGRTYILGRDKELTANGNHWVLDLSKGTQRLSVGTYDIAVEVITNDGKILHDATKDELVIVEKNQEGGGIMSGNETTAVCLPHHWYSHWWLWLLLAIIAGLLLVIWRLWWLLGRRSKNAGQD